MAKFTYLAPIFILCCCFASIVIGNDFISSDIGVIFNALKLRKYTISIVLTVFNINGFALRKLNKDKLS